MRRTCLDVVRGVIRPANKVADAAHRTGVPCLPLQEEDNLALEKYQRRDEAKVKELNLHIEKLSKEVAEARVALADEVTETQSKQIQLDKTAEDFRRLHQERQELVQQWDDAMDAMRRRDEMIQARPASRLSTGACNGVEGEVETCGW